MKRKHLAKAKARKEEYIKYAYRQAKNKGRDNDKTREILGVALVKQIKLETEHYQAIESIQKNLTKAVRPLYQWKPPRTRRTDPVIKNLARYLFAEYRMPAFMDNAWMDDKEEYHQWYISMGKGMNIRKLNIPLNYTKRMSHYFTKAPHNISVGQALRWGQVMGLGGDKRLASIIATGPLGKNLTEDDFWSKVVIFMKNQPMLDPALINPLIDYIHNQKFARQRYITEDGNYEFLPPIAPGFSMKGRSITSLLRGMETWHKELRSVKRPQVNNTWKGLAKPDWDYVEGVGRNQKYYRVVQLKSSLDLIDEGRAMKHCVSSYAYSCSQGRCSIWSLRLGNQFHVKPLVTIEVNARNEIVQARGKCNAYPSQAEESIIRRWAGANGLTTQYHYC